MLEFEINGQKYRSGKLDAMTQWHVVRRLGPVLPALGPMIASAQTIKAAAEAGNSAAIADQLPSMAPAVQAIAAMKDEDSEYVMGTCLSVVEREQPGGRGWAKVWNKEAKRPMFEDIDLLHMLQITYNVLRDQFSSFFPVAS